MKLNRGAPPDNSPPQHDLYLEGTTDCLRMAAISRRGLGVSADWGGYLVVPADGEYTFYWSHPQWHAQLWVGDTVVGDGEAQVENKVTLKLAKGCHRVRYILVIDDSSFDPTPQAYLQMSWQGPGMATRRAMTPDDFRRGPTIWEPKPGPDVVPLYTNAPPPRVRTLSTARGGAPTAVLAAIPVPGKARLWKLDASKSSGNAGQKIVAYHWCFGDGQTERTTEPVVEHGYGAGLHAATVMVESDGGHVAAASIQFGEPVPPQATAIGVWFGPHRYSFALESTTFAGWVPQANWNLGRLAVETSALAAAPKPNPGSDSKPAPAVEPMKLVDSLGVRTDVTVSASGKSAETGLADGTTGDETLMGHGLSASGITLRAIPYESYDLLVYVSQAFGEPNRKEVQPLLAQDKPGQFSVTVGDKTISVAQKQNQPVFSGFYIPVEKDGIGNVLVFTNLKGSEQTIRLGSLNLFRAGISAIQVVKR